MFIVSWHQDFCVYVDNVKQQKLTGGNGAGRGVFLQVQLLLRKRRRNIKIYTLGSEIIDSP